MGTLRDAGNLITKLPKAKLRALEWLAAIKALILVAGRDGDTMLPGIGIMRSWVPGSLSLCVATPLAKERNRSHLLSGEG